MTEKELPKTVSNVEKKIQEVKRQHYSMIWDKIKPVRIINIYKYGNLHMSKMVEFLLEVKPKMSDIEYWQSIENYPLARKSKEKYEDYKIRRRFINDLQRFRKEIKSFCLLFSMQEIEAKMEEDKKSKEENLETKSIEIIKK